MERQRIAIITGQLVVGGSERQLYLWLSNLNRDLFDPVVVTLHPGAHDHWEAPIKTLGIPLLQNHDRHNWVLRLVRLARTLSPYKPRLIHGWNLFTSPYAGLLAKMLHAKSMGSLRDNLRIFNAHPREAALTQHLVDALLVNSRSAANELAAAGKCRKQKIYVVQNAVEEITADRLQLRTELSRRFKLDENKLWIGSMGRLVSKKRFDLLLEVFSSLRKHTNEIELLLVGDGPLRDELRTRADTLGISGSVTFVGEQPEARTWLPALDIFCFTSLDEGLPNVVMEAAAAGKPIVAWNVPFVEELLTHQDSAILVRPGDCAGMEHELLALMRNSQSRLELGQAARRKMLDEFSLGRFLERMTFAYRDLLGMHGRDSDSAPD